MTARLLLSLGLVVGLLGAGQPASAVPQRISFQGKLMDAASNPRDGAFDFTFRLYGVPVGGSASWVETQTSIPVVNGAFSVQLGAAQPLTTGLFTGTSAYLEITVEPDPPMVPRQLLLMSPYAFRALLADELAPGSIGYIESRSSLQAGAVFHVASGTVAGAFVAAGSSSFTAVGGQTFSLTTSSGIRVLAGTLRVGGAGVDASRVSAATVAATAALLLPQGPPSSAEGALRWEPAQNLLFVGTGTASKTIVDSDSAQSLANKTLSAADGNVIDATRVQGRAISAEPPSDGMALGWNAAGAQWQPVSLATITSAMTPFTPAANVALQAGTIYVTPVVIPGVLRLNQIRLRVSNNDPGATGDAGLYDSSGHLVASGGSGSIDFGANGVAVVTVSGAPKTIRPGQYYAAITSDGTPGVRGTNLGAASIGVLKGLGTLSGGGVVLPVSLTLSAIVDFDDSVFLGFNE